MEIIYYRIKCLVKMKGVIFWSCFLPILLSTLYFISEKNEFETVEQDQIPIGIVYDDTEHITKESIFDPYEYKEHVLSQEMAEKYLQAGSIVAYAKIGKRTELIAQKCDKQQIKAMAYLDAYINHIPMSEVRETLIREIEQKENSPFLLVRKYYVLVFVTILSILFVVCMVAITMRLNRKSMSDRIMSSPKSMVGLALADTCVCTLLALFLFIMMFIYLFYILV